MGAFEAIHFWMATLLAAATFFLTVWGAVMKKAGAVRLGQYLFIVSFLLMTVFGVWRWIGTGHPPFVTRFESMFMSVWFIQLTWLIIHAATRRAAVLLAPVSLVTFLMLGWASSMSTEASPLSQTLDNVWLFIHASFATAGAASFLIAASFSTIVLLGEERIARWGHIIERLPDRVRLPGSILNFIILGLILWGVMIVSGSIWANIAWGRYWAWDPIELWSLISWLLFGLVLHTRLTFKLSHRAFCWLTIISALTIVFALWGVGYVYKTIHSYG